MKQYKSIYSFRDVFSIPFCLFWDYDLLYRRFCNRTGREREMEEREREGGKGGVLPENAVKFICAQPHPTPPPTPFSNEKLLPHELCFLIN